MRKAFVLLIGMAWMLPSSLMGQPGQANAADDARSVPGQLLVQFRAGATPADKARALGRANAQFVEDVLPASRRRDGRGDLVLVRHQPDLPPTAARQALQSDAAVEFAEPNWIYEHQTASDDYYYLNGSLWGMYGPATTPSNEFGSNAAAAWADNHTGSTGSAVVYVGVIDEGIQFTHPDLDRNVGGNPLEVANGIDDDGNGYVDDIYGWDFNDNNNTIYDGGIRGNLDDHGTHVAGTIGARGGNGSGVAGVNWDIKLISGKFLGRNGGTTANAIKAIDYITDLKTLQGLNIVATNNSWGGGGSSQALYDAISRANDANILFVAAAGNGNKRGIGQNTDLTPNYPSSYDLPNIIAVGSLTSTGAMSSFSNYGLTSVDIFAPGSGIYSTTAPSTYSSYSGTSMATPHVTGAAALYKSVYPTATAAQIKNAILSSAVPTTSVTGKCVTGGRLDVFKALLIPPTSN